LGIAEIGRNNLKEFEGFKNRYVSLLENWEVERRYVAYGIGRTAEIVRDAYPNPVELLLEVLEELKYNPNFVVYAVWALGMLKAEEVRLFVNDKRIAKLYNGEEIVEVRICDIARSFTLKS
jgi:hypothetical protein